MWLTTSSVGRKVVMSVTGLFLVLFVTFHALMNVVAVFSPSGYDAVCEFLGANWYAVLGSAVIALAIAIHFIYAAWLTLQNRKARGNDRYAVSKNWKEVDWQSKNMFAIGLIVVCFLILHLVQFWAKMQLPELINNMGGESCIEPYTSGHYALYEVFKHVWVLPVYLIGFAALWFHLTHGFWSAFQTLGAAGDKWIGRWKTCAMWWATILFILFAFTAIYLTWDCAF